MHADAHVRSMTRPARTMFGFPAQIVNDDIDRAYEELKKIIKDDIEAAQKATGSTNQ